MSKEGMSKEAKLLTTCLRYSRISCSKTFAAMISTLMSNLQKRVIEGLAGLRRAFIEAMCSWMVKKCLDMPKCEVKAR